MEPRECPQAQSLTVPQLTSGPSVRWVGPNSLSPRPWPCWGGGGGGEGQAAVCDQTGPSPAPGRGGGCLSTQTGLQRHRERKGWLVPRGG